MRNANTAMLDDADAYMQPSRIEPEPTEWDYKLVEARMVEAFEILRGIPGSTGPKSFGSNWPVTLQEFAGLVGAEAPKTVLRRQITSAEMSRMEEALAWPSLLIDGTRDQDDHDGHNEDTRHAYAFNLWAWAKANERKLAPMLRELNKRACAIAKEMQATANARRHTARRQLASEPTTWANKRYWLSDGSSESRERIIHNAIIRLERRLAKNDLISPVVMIKPSEAVPDRVISRPSLDRHRFEASALIARKLNRAMVRVRVR